MCGIFAVLTDSIDDSNLDHLEKSIHRRGPDYQSGTRRFTTKCGLKLKLAASILHLRGDQMQEQPFRDDQGNILLFNGQIYQYSMRPLPVSVSDTLFLAERLAECKTKYDISGVISRIDGPFAFIYWHEYTEVLFYGRDIFGRKSLCSLEEAAKDVVVSSVAPKLLETGGFVWSEVPCDGIIAVDFSQPDRPVKAKMLWDLDRVYPSTEKCLNKDIEDRDIMRTRYISLEPLSYDLRQPSQFSEEEKCRAIDTLSELLIRSVSMRVKLNQVKCLVCRSSKDSTSACDHSKSAVAFSGGIDSTLIALALDKVLDREETIDLITVAFKDGSPDRESAGKAFVELRKLCPERAWNLIICDITQDELVDQRKSRICDLIWPCRLVIDDSLGCACWFVARGKGRCLDRSMSLEDLDKYLPDFLKFDPQNDTRNYQCPATMLFAGSSIDEQLGGYSAHRISWSKTGISGFINEISHQMRRLPTRNLGRDDRVYSDHGRDLKLPYLDFELVSFLNQTPAGLKADFSESPTTGPKKLLRDLAHRWGLVESSRRVKRALQFGTRIANLEKSKEKGDEICERLL